MDKKLHQSPRKRISGINCPPCQWQGVAGYEEAYPLPRRARLTHIANISRGFHQQHFPYP
ncbi:MAG: hypothetical protein ACFFD2_11310 [Promethearchaeota archaeon]